MLALQGVARTLEAGAAGCAARVRVLDGVTLRLAPREFVAVTGGAACERSLLLLCAAGLARVDAGVVAAQARCRYVRGSELGDRHTEPILLVDEADSLAAIRAIARALARGATVLAAGADAGAFARAGARVLTLRDGALVERAPAAPVRRERVAERALR